MSAFQCSDKHILIVAALEFCELSWDKKELQTNIDVKFNVIYKTARMLNRANTKSVNYRYSSKEKVTPLPVITAKTLQGWLNDLFEKGNFPLQAVKLINCLDYQSCEYPSYANSNAKGYLDKMELKFLRLHAVCMTPEYDKLIWAID